MTNIYKSSEGERAVRERYLKFLQYWPGTNQQLRVPTREGETFVVASGPENAPPLVLLHGTAFNSTMWMGDVSAWATQFRVFAVDIIGDAGLSAPSRPALDSDAHALWLDDVLQGLSIERTSFVGISFGGWLALDYATRRPERVTKLVVLAPAGVGRQKNVLLWAVPMLMLGPWGRRKVTARILGPAPANPSRAQQAVADFMSLIFKNFRYRTARFPIFSDDALRRLTMPVLAILGGNDALVDSPVIRQRLERSLPKVEIRYLPDTGHAIVNQTAPILDFLRGRRTA